MTYYIKTCLFILIHLKNRFVRLTSLKTFENSMITLVYLVSVLVNSWSNKPKEYLAHLFKQMYVDEIDFDTLTIEKLIDLVFTEMVYCKIQQLDEETLAKRDQTDGNQWTRFRECFKMVDNEEQWISYAERALELFNHDVMGRGVVEACKILKYPEPSTEITLKHCLICHVSFGSRYILNLKELHLLTI